MNRLLAFTLLVAALPSAVGRAQTRELGPLVYDGIPEVPERLGERAAQYQAARGANFLDWQPDGGMLISTRFGETNQVHRVAAPGGDRRQLTFEREPINEAHMARARGDRGFFYRIDTGGGEFYQYYWYELATGIPHLVTDGKSRNGGFLPSNAGSRFAFSSTQRNGKDFDIYVLDGFDGRTVRRVRDCEGEWSALDWSPDDRELLLRQYVSINESTIYAFDLASGRTTPINAAPDKKIAYSHAVFARAPKAGRAVYYTSDEDSEFHRLWWHDLASGKREVISPALTWDVADFAISPDGATLAYTVNEGGRSALFLTSTAQPKKPVRIELPTGVVIGHMKFDAKSQRLGLTLSTAQSIADAYAVDVKSRKLTRFTFSEVGGLNPAVFVTPERIEFKSFDERPISAWYYRPRKAGPDRKVPVIVAIHGGPEAQSTAAFSAQIQFWVNELGAAVLAPNVRGSAGYGKTFLTLDDSVKRMDSVKDIGHLLDWLATRPELDAQRVAVYGGSYGGFMVLATMYSFPERIRCGVDVVGISNLVTFLEHTESYRRDQRRAEYGDERDPAVREFMLSTAPLKNASKIQKPLFVAQGKNDPRVPASEAEQIVQTVRKAGKTVWYLLARDEGHGFQKKSNRDAFQNATTLFFEDYLLK
jgi:dipeptidyl aminopeptidase/acylaminoacyl peptidase